MLGGRVEKFDINGQPPLIECHSSHDPHGEQVRFGIIELCADGRRGGYASAVVDAGQFCRLHYAFPLRARADIEKGASHTLLDITDISGSGIEGVGDVFRLRPSRKRGIAAHARR